LAGGGNSVRDGPLPDGGAPGARRVTVRGAVLAGGAARRYGGRPKGLVELGGRRILDRVLDVVAAVTGDAPLLGGNAPDAACWPRLRPRHRRGPGAWPPAGHWLPRRCEGRYTTPRARPGGWQPGRPVFEPQPARGLGTGGGGVAATRMISIIGRKNAGKTTLL